MDIPFLKAELSRVQTPVELAAALQLGEPDRIQSEPFYIHYSSLFPAQTRISQDGVEEKIEKAKAKGNAVWDQGAGSWSFKHDSGKSILSIKSPIPIVKAPFGFIPADGHHDIRASLELGAETIPVQIIADLSHLSIEEFWEQAEAEGWAYLYNLEGVKTTPVEHFQDLVDDPNRRFAGITARKYDSDGSSRGAEYPLWIKMERDVPFIEFIIGDALRQNGLVFPGNEPSIEFVEKARQILLNANIEGLKVLPNRIHYSQIDLNNI